MSERNKKLLCKGCGGRKIYFCYAVRRVLKCPDCLGTGIEPSERTLRRRANMSPLKQQKAKL